MSLARSSTAAKSTAKSRGRQSFEARASSMKVAAYANEVKESNAWTTFKFGPGFVSYTLPTFLSDAFSV